MSGDFCRDANCVGTIMSLYIYTSPPAGMCIFWIYLPRIVYFCLCISVCMFVCMYLVCVSIIDLSVAVCYLSFVSLFYITRRRTKKRDIAGVGDDNLLHALLEWADKEEKSLLTLSEDLPTASRASRLCLDDLKKEVSTH